MSTVFSVMDRGEWGANTDNIVVVDPTARKLLWIPRDLWCESIGDRINRAFARRGHDGLIAALQEHGVTAEHSVCLRREAVGRAIEGASVTVPVRERLAFRYPLRPERAIEDGSKLVVFEPPEERLEGERLHQWIGARYDDPSGARPLVRSGDFGRIRRQQDLVRRLLASGFDFTVAVADPELVSASSRAALAELASIEGSWRFDVIEDVRAATRRGMMVLERGAAASGGPGPAERSAE